jgi:hypothetical protein
MMNKYLDTGSFVIALITLGLFAAALFTKGLTHDLFLETGVFLVSLKIIIMAYRNNVSVSELDKKLNIIMDTLKKDKDKNQKQENML